MYKYILFDLDGTLTDPKEGITKSVQYALEKNGITPPSADELMCFIGPPLVESFQRFYGMEKEQAEKATADYRERYGPIGLYENEIFEGIKEMLETLKNSGKKIGLATSKPTKFAMEILENFHIKEYFDVAYGSEFHTVRQTKTEVMADVLKDMYEIARSEDNIEYEQFLKQCVMVGDRIHDIEGARNCNIKVIGVRYGYAPENELEEGGADYIVDTVKELQNFLLAEEQ